MTYSFIVKDFNFKVEKLEDLPTLGEIMKASEIKPNFSLLANELGVDRRTVKKYYEGYNKPKTRDKPSKVEKYNHILDELLDENSIQRFYNKAVLYRFLKEKYSLDVCFSSFSKYISNNEKYNYYFKKKKGQSKAVLRYEVMPGEEAQIDWKENVHFRTTDGEVITINIFVFILSYSRFRLFYVSESKSQEMVLDFLTRSFETVGGVPKRLLTDNMRTVMNEARSRNNKGVVNTRFQEFLRDFGVKLKPCMARRPQTKGKVESSMKLLEEIHAYQGMLTYKELLEFIKDLNNRLNLNIHKGTNKIPLDLLRNEKDLLLPLPNDKIRDHYKILLKQLKVNSSCMITYKNNQYSVPLEYLNKVLTIKVLDNMLYVYDTTKLVTIHRILNKKLNYHRDDYERILKFTCKNMDEEKIKNIAKNNLKALGDIYGTDA